MAWLDLLEALFLATLATGVGFIYWPAALIVAGVLGMAACEWKSTEMKRASAAAMASSLKSKPGSAGMAPVSERVA